MKNYDNVTAKELHNKKMEMLNYLGRNGERCNGVYCINCPLDNTNNGKNISCVKLEAEHFYEYVKIIMEYELKSKVDWENVEVNTRILVRNNIEDEWRKRHFARYENGKIYCWVDGCTSFTAYSTVRWTYAKLYNGEEE
jgi:hypothetical protein